VTASNGLIYAIAGGTGLPTCCTSLSTVEEYDAATNNWVTQTSLPVGVSGQAAVLGPNGKLYVLGGAPSGGGRLSIVQEGTLADAPVNQPKTSTYYLHGTGANANPATLFVSTSEPTSATEKYKDSPAVHFAGGNPWQDVGTWTSTPPPAAGTVVSLSDLHAWLGLKNSDDQGTQFDLRAEVYRNGTLVASGQTLCITNITRNAAQALDATVAFGAVSPMSLNGTSDQFSVKVLTRIGTNPDGSKCAGPGGSHTNATGLRLYFDATDRPSRFGVATTP